MDTNKETQMVKIGDTIKALDFPGREDCYMIGEVYMIRDDEIHCETRKVVWAGVASTEERQVRKTFVTHSEGTHFLDKHFPGRITVI